MTTLLWAFIAKPSAADMTASMMKPRPPGVRHSLPEEPSVTGAAPSGRRGATDPRGLGEEARASASRVLYPCAMQSPPHIFSAAPSRRDSATAGMLVVAVGVLMQAGSALAVMVIDSVGVVEALWLRTALAAVLLAAVRPRLVRLPPKGDRLHDSRADRQPVGYELLLLPGHQSRAPVGIVVAVEFLGYSLGVAVAGSRAGCWIVAWVVAGGRREWGSSLESGRVWSVALGLLFALSAGRRHAGRGSSSSLPSAPVSRVEPSAGDRP